MKNTRSVLLLLAIVAILVTSCKPHRQSCAAYDHLQLERSAK
jgi:hypothetical protein